MQERGETRGSREDRKKYKGEGKERGERQKQEKEERKKCSRGLKQRKTGDGIRKGLHTAGRDGR